MHDSNNRPPRIWLVLGDKLGDNAQVEIIAEAMGLPYTVKRLLPKQEYVLGKPRFKASLYHLDMERSDRLEPPWPDLILTIGRRHSMAALWIRQQSGNRSRLVLVGRPRRWIERFDLVITPPQYGVPDLPNVERLDFPLMRIDSQAVSEAASAWRERLHALPRPLIAVLVGGATRPFRFDAGVTEQLLERCRELQERYSGTLYFSTSRRTSRKIVDALRNGLAATAQLYEWSPDSASNPYKGLLGLADYFVVTGDSVSMMIEVAANAKPLAIFPLPTRWWGRWWQGFTGLIHGKRPTAPGQRVFRALGRLLYRSGLVGFSRDLSEIHRALASRGLAVYLGEPFNQPGQTLPDELGRVRERIRQLLP